MYQAHYLTEQGIKEYKATISRQHFLDLKRKKATKENCENLIRLVFHHFNISFDLAKTKSRKREIIIARQFAMYFLRQEFYQLSLQGIADFFDKDHSTVVYSIKQINNLCEYDSEFQENKKNIMQRIIEMYK
jgi:chromosomal replication initiator protein